MNKKAIMALNMALWIPRIIFLVIVILSVVAFTITYASKEIDVWRSEAETIAQRIIYSPHGISYHDPLSNRLYPGIIDTTKMKTEFLENAMFYGGKEEDKKHIGASIIITNQNTGDKIAEADYHPKTARRIEEKGFMGRGGVDAIEKELYVLVKEGEELIPAIAKITVVVPRS